MLLWSCAVAVLVCFLANDSVANSQSAPGGEYVKATGSVRVGNASSSEVVTLTGVQRQVECLIRCLSVGCPLASFIPGSRECQLLQVNDASQGPGPARTHVERLVGSEDSAEVWTVGNFNEFIMKRLPNITTVLQNSGTGRFGSVQSVTIPTFGCYRIEASGAKGGTNSGRAGGNGAVMSGTFNLTSGTELAVVVGQAGGSPRSIYAGGGGGGGSFVYQTVDSQLLIAAGGGGSGTYSEAGSPGEAGTNGSSVASCTMPMCYKGTDGQPGFNDPSLMPFTHNPGGCGAGWLGKPVNARRSTNDGDGGGSRAEGWVGGAAGRSNTGVGGFGGGGGGGDLTSVYGASGAGGGYSGGATSYVTSWSGGGGGSFCSGNDCVSITGGNTGQHGQVVIRLIGFLC